MYNDDGRKEATRGREISRRVHHKQLVRMGCLLGVLCWGLGCSLQNLDYLSDELVPAAVGGATSSCAASAGGQLGLGGNLAVAGTAGSTAG